MQIICREFAGHPQPLNCQRCEEQLQVVLESRKGPFNIGVILETYWMRFNKIERGTDEKIDLT
jgi:hypothetical protein